MPRPPSQLFHSREGPGLGDPSLLIPARGDRFHRASRWGFAVSWVHLGFSLSVGKQEMQMHVNEGIPGF